MCCGALLALPAAAGAFAAGLLVARLDTAAIGAALGTEALASAASALGVAAAPLTSGLGLLTLLGALMVAVTVAWLLGLWLLVSADADCALLLRGKHAPDAFKDKVVWVTGASQGLGATLAKYFAGKGAKIIISARNEKNLERVRAAVPLPPESVLILPFDLLGSSGDELAAVAKAADEAFDGAGVDILIHTAGASQHALAAETTSEVAQRLLDINTLAPIRLTQAVLPHMLKRRKGQLVLIASMAAKVPSPGQSVYAGAKAGALGYFASLATEVADQGVAVTVVCPGPVSSAVADTSPRTVFGPTRPVHKLELPDPKRMPPSRAAVLIANAVAGRVSEAWLARQPVLLLAYLMQYAPSVGTAIMKRVGPGRARALAAGRSGYDVRALVSDRS